MSDFNPTFPRIAQTARTTLVALLATSHCAFSTSAAETSSPCATNPPPVTISQFTDNTARGKIRRCLVQSGGDQFTLVVPDGFRAQSEGASGVIQFRKLNSPAWLIVEAQPRPESPLVQRTHSDLETEVQRAYPHARVTDRFTANVAGNRVPVLEFSHTDPTGQSHTERLTLVLFPLTTIRITAKAPAPFFRSCDHAFNQLLLSVRAGAHGSPAGFQQFLQDL